MEARLELRQEAEATNTQLASFPRRNRKGQTLIFRRARNSPWAVSQDLFVPRLAFRGGGVAGAQSVNLAVPPSNLR